MQNRKKPVSVKRDMVILLALGGIALLLWLFFRPDTEHLRVEILIDSKIVQVLSLTEDSREQALPFTSDYGRNTVLVQDGHIRVSHADCPDQICVQQGALKPGGLPIVCLPNRFVVQWATEAQEIDAQVGRKP